MAEQLLEPPLVVNFGEPDMMMMLMLWQLVGPICLPLMIYLVDLPPQPTSQIMQTVQLLAVVSVLENDLVQAVRRIKFVQDSIVLLHIAFHHFLLFQLLSALSNITCIK